MPTQSPRGLSPGRRTPHQTLVCIAVRPRFESRLVLGSVSESHPGTAKCPEPLCLAPALPLRGRHLVPPGRALPLRRRSYGLMRQTCCPPPGFGIASRRWSLQVAASPCWAQALPDVISADPSSRVWTPTPAAPRVLLPVASPRTLAFPALGPGRRVAASRQPLLSGLNFEAAVIL